MIKLKSTGEIQLMRRAGRIAAGARALAGSMAVAGMRTREINSAVHDYIISKGATPAFLNYEGFPASVCVSINEEVIHGIPADRRLRDGDIVSVDVGAIKDGYFGDCADTFIVGRASDEATRLVESTRRCFFEALEFTREGFRISDISGAVQRCAEADGFSLVRAFVGHGVGSNLHESPQIPNYVEKPRRGPNPRILRGMTLAIEPMVNVGGYDVVTGSDGWTITTKDGSLSAHYENTVLVTTGDPEILTVTEDARDGA
jgi:methionyl aminopeptidase